MPRHRAKPNRSSLRLAAAVVAAVLVVAACGSGSETATDSAVSGEASGLPQTDAATVDGSQLAFGSLEGRDAVLWFWAPW